MDTSRILRTAGIPAVAVILAVLALLFTGPTLATTLQFALVMAALGLSFQLVYGLLGELSLGQPALFGTGCYVFSVLAVNQVDTVTAIVVAVVGAAAVGAFVALVTSRLVGAYFAVVTLSLSGLGALIVSGSPLFGADEGLIGVPSLPDPLGSRPTSQLLYGMLLLAIALATFALVRGSRLGRALESVRSSPDLARSMGIRIGTVRIVITALSGALAGLCGVVYAQSIRFVAPDVFGMYYIVTPLAIVAIGGARALWGTIPGAVLVVVLPRILNFDPVVAQIFAAAVLLIVFITMPDGLLPQLARAVRSSRRKRSPGREGAAVAEEGAGAAAAPLEAAPPRDPGEVILEAVDVTVSFGAFRAVDGMSLTLRRGEVLGLIGANGAGKSTLVNAITGHVPARADRILLAGDDLRRHSSTARARSGLARTFQQPLLPLELTVRNSLRVAHARGRLFRRRSDETAAVDRILAVVGLQALAEVPVSELTFLDRRLLSIGLALVADPLVLILDEATAGLTGSERHSIGEVIQAIARAENGPGVIVIEHDVPFVARVCDRILVMNEGRLIASGSADEVLVDPDVVASYLGGGD